MILAGDIGGTHARLALFEPADCGLSAVVEETFASREWASFDQVVQEFVGRHRVTIDAACFGIAGPVRSGRVTTTNLPWVVDARALARELQLSFVGLLNDLEANAYGVAALDAKDIVTLNPGSSNREGNGAIIAAGTGLGEAGLYWDGREHHPFASEGGHCDFAARSALEVDLLSYLRHEFSHVSYERVLSGAGLHNIYRFLRDTGHGTEPEWLAQRMAGKDPAPVISEAGLAGTSDLCVRALDLFVTIYGAEAGNLVLKLMATGGLYVGGGIAPKIHHKLADGAFMEAFVDKGDRKSTRLNSSHIQKSRMPSSA